MVGVAMIFIHQSLVTLNLFQPKCWKKAPFSGPGGGKAKEGGPWKADPLKAQPFQPGKASRLLCTWRRLSRPFHHPLVLLYTRWWHTPHTALWKHTYNSWTKRRNGICNIRIWNYFVIIKKVFLLSPNIIKIIYYEYDLHFGRVNVI